MNTVKIEVEIPAKLEFEGRVYEPTREWRSPTDGEVYFDDIGRKLAKGEWFFRKLFIYLQRRAATAERN